MCFSYCCFSIPHKSANDSSNSYLHVFAYIPLIKNYFHSFPLILQKGLKSHLCQEATSNYTFVLDITDDIYIFILHLLSKKNEINEGIGANGTENIS